MTMINNPAKVAYMKFDAFAKAMQVTSSVPTKDISKDTKGLLKRLKQKGKDNKEETKEQQPLEVAIDYFVAIRKQRNNLKQEAQ